MKHRPIAMSDVQVGDVIHCDDAPVGGRVLMKVVHPSTHRWFKDRYWVRFHKTDAYIKMNAVVRVDPSYTPRLNTSTKQTPRSVHTSPPSAISGK